MSMQGLNLDNIPPLQIPFRFFNTAPWMGVLAALTIWFTTDSQVFSSQWHPSLLAATHLITLGFMAMIMLGALFQVLPVISGESIPAQSFVSLFVHLTLLSGTLLMATGFAFSKYTLFDYAIPLLLAAFLCFLFALASRVSRYIPGGHSINAIRLAAISLLITILIGALKAMGFSHPGMLNGLLDVSYTRFTYFHIGWGLAGWLLFLVMAVSFQVIPMFHVTPNFPPKLTKYLPFIAFSLLTLLTLVPDQITQCVLLLALYTCVNTYAITAIRTLLKRRRKLLDITVKFWHLALGNLILASTLMLCRFADETLALHWLSEQWASLNILIGLVMIVGFACSVIMGMLQKIIPFLIYMHLQRRCQNRYELVKSIPNMRAIIPEKRSIWQFRLHVLALTTLTTAIFIPMLEPAASLALAFDFGWLGYTVNKASRLYWQHNKRLIYELTNR